MIPAAPGVVFVFRRTTDAPRTEGARYDADSMVSAFPAPRSRHSGRRSGRPVPVGALIGEVLPARVQTRLVRVSRIRQVWEAAVPEVLRVRLHPESFERGILTLRASDPEAARAAGRRRKELRNNLRRALRLPGAGVRFRIRKPAPKPALQAAREDPEKDPEPAVARGQRPDSPLRGSVSRRETSARRPSIRPAAPRRGRAGP